MWVSEMRQSEGALHCVNAVDVDILIFYVLNNRDIVLRII
jgi:hypothetical protein